METNKQAKLLALWAVATFSTVTFVIGVLAIFHWRDALGNLLGKLDSVLGVGVFCVLWATTWWSARKYLRKLGDLLDATLSVPVQELTRQAGSSGAVNGLLFSLLAVIGVAGSFGEFFIIPFFFWGFLLAAGIGFLIGIVVGLLVSSVLIVASWLVLKCTVQSGNIEI